jgi:hypothetical protein
VLVDDDRLDDVTPRLDVDEDELLLLELLLENVLDEEKISLMV